MHTWGAGRQDSLLSSSQGLGAPAGALVGGPKDFIEEAWRLRKALGGGMRQSGVLAAAALVGLADVEKVLPRDHQNAWRFAKGTWTTAPHPHFLLLPEECLDSLVAGPKSPAGVHPSDSRTCMLASEPRGVGPRKLECFTRPHWWGVWTKKHSMDVKNSYFLAEWSL